MDSPVLPPELEREMFETAALLDFRTIPSLLRVARRVLEWIEPLLYRVVVIGRSSQKDKAYRRALELKPTVLAKSVQHLFVIDIDLSHWLEDDMNSLLQLCATQLLSLASFSSAFYKPTLLPVLLQAVWLRRWAGRLECLFGGHSAVDLSFPSFPVFHTITHMDIFDHFTDENEEAICAGLASLPCLTHLCLSYSTRLDPIARILIQCPRLRLLVLMDVEDEMINEIAENPPTMDVRFVVSGAGSYSRDWEVGARGGTDFWAAADEFVARKRRGEIEASHFLLDHF
ncbi:hypothetical protein MSAN_00534500 [Mycena sanguinolenta]|uniref:F-box domain-containing protein n=1 Tax=Mycena sanguinolenta TaxID=230812 RepID=A0A8H7DJ60_9AGAR|nr:hypothetical protein MSAN_00534500 [Mycena sanguinolenta]